MTGSKIATAIDYLIVAAQNGLGVKRVFDGAAVSDTIPDYYVIIGLPDVDSDVLDEAARSDQNWAWIGHSMRDENITVHCVGVSYNGSSDQKAARDNAFLSVDTFATAIQNDPTLGVSTGLFYVTGFSNVSLRQSQDENGAMAAVSFDVQIRARFN